jgi:hypothetical protein
VRKAFLLTTRPAGITTIIIALFSACSSPASDGTRSDPNARTSRRATKVALQENEEARLARKAKAKEDAQPFVRLAQDACRELTRKTETLTADSTVDSSELSSFIPPELYPTEPFAAYVDEATLADVKSQMTQLISSLVDLLRPLERNNPTSLVPVERQRDDVVKMRAAFQEKKLKMLASINAYCESVRRAGAGMGPLR